MNQVTTQDQAINVLIQAVRIGQSKGAFTIEDAAVIDQAIKLFVKPAPEATATTPEAEVAVETETVKN